jgi:1,4-dihydroxy-2-naphthoate octaprenyltransferase
MLIVMVTPAVCFAIGMILVDTRKHSRFSRLDWCALLAALFPVTLGTLLAVWAVRVLFSMSGIGY